MVIVANDIEEDTENDVVNDLENDVGNDMNDLENDVVNEAAPGIVPDIIPDYLWNIFPSSGQYIRHLMKFAGYQSRKAILSLTNKEEMKTMLQFAIDMNGCMDADEKKRVFGIFAKSPEKLQILPGLQETFNSFLKSVEDLTSVKKKSTNSAPNKIVRKEKKTIRAPYETVETLTEKMVNWCSKKGFKGEQKFTIKHLYNKFSALCLVCGIDIEIIGFSLSNIQKHITMRCWMNPEAMTKKKKRGQIRDSSTSSISSYLIKTTKHPTTSVQNSSSPSASTSATKVVFNIVGASDKVCISDDDADDEVQKHSKNL